MSKLSFNLKALGCIGATLVVLFALLAYDRSNRRLPDPKALKYLPYGASLYVMSSPLNSLWERIAIHVDRVRSDQNPVDEALNMTRESLANSCVVLDRPEALSAFGIDIGRGLTFATYGAPLATSGRANWLAVLPVRDSVSFIRLLSSAGPMRQRTKQITLAAAPDVTAKQIRITEITSSGTRLCQSDGTPVNLHDTIPTSDNGIILNVAPDVLSAGELGVACVSVDEAGEEQACECPETDCRVAIDEASRADATFDPTTDQPLSVELDGAYIRFVADYALVGPDKDFVESSTLSTAQYERMHSQAGTLYSSYQLLGGNAVSADPWIIGDLQLPSPIANGAFPIALAFEPTSLSFRATFRVNAARTGILQKMLEPSVSVPPLPPEGSVAGLTASGRELLELWSYATRWLKETSSVQKIIEGLGDFGEAVNVLADDPNVRSFQLVVLGLRDGIPEVALAAGLDRNIADRTVAKLQSILRQRRDYAILDGALQQYSKDAGAQAKNAVTVADLASAGLLSPEDGGGWDQYKIVNAQVGGTANDALFAGPSYRFQIGSHSAAYVMPPFTDNDLRYRIPNEPNPESADALRAGRFRLASAYLEEAQTLWIGTDKGTIETLLNANLYTSTSPHCLSTGRTEPAKILLCIAPALLVSQRSPEDDGLDCSREGLWAECYRALVAEHEWWAKAYNSFVASVASTPSQDRFVIEGRLE